MRPRRLQRLVASVGLISAGLVTTGQTLTLAGVVLGLSGLCYDLSASETVDPLAATVKQREALRQDPTLDAPFAGLVEAWRSQDRLSDLLTIYRDHVARYPHDRAAQVVLIRLHIASRDPAAVSGALAAAQARPTDPFLRFLAYRALAEAKDPRALDQLSEAISNETAAWRKRLWSDRLIQEAEAAGRRDVLITHLAWSASTETTPTGKLAVAQRQMQAGQHEAALAVLRAAATLDPAPETQLDIDLAASDCFAALGHSASAAAQLDALLGRVAADHWRRPELLRRRLRVAGADGIAGLLRAAATAVQQRPDDEAAQLDYAALLDANDRRREAADLLAAASQRRPASARLERETLAVMARLYDPELIANWLEQRLRSMPDRADLRLRRAEALFELRQSAAATEELAIAWRALPAERRLIQLLELARRLRKSALHQEAAAVLQQALASAPDRFDLRRELAESLVASGQAEAAVTVFDLELPRNSAPEHVLDAVRWLAQSQQPSAAMRLATARLRQDPGHFELLVETVRIAAKSGQPARALHLAITARALADTTPRYRLCLETMVEATAEEGQGAVIAAELKRLDAEIDHRDRSERRQAFVDVIATVKSGIAVATTVLRTDLAALTGSSGSASAGAVPTLAPRRASMERQLIALIGNDVQRKSELQELLQRLALDDPSSAMECAAQRLLLELPADIRHASFDKATMAKLTALDPAQLTDPLVLTRLSDCYVMIGDATRLKACAARSCQVAPTNRANWARWLSVLALLGDDDTLRREGQRVLAGIDGLELSPEIRRVLTARLVRSGWNSLARAAATSAWTRCLRIADDIEPLTTTAAERSWLAMSRAIALARSGQLDAAERWRRDALRLAKIAHPPDGPEDLQSDVALSARSATVSATVSATTSATTSASASTAASVGTDSHDSGTDISQLDFCGAGEEELTNGVVFPDGLIMGKSARLAPLTVTQSPPLPDRLAPLPPLSCRWIHDQASGIGTPVGRDGRLFFAAGAGDLTSLDVESGKLLWSVAKAVVQSQVEVNQAPYHHHRGYRGDEESVKPLSPPALTLGPVGIVTSSEQGLTCYDSAGHEQWKSTVVTGSFPIASGNLIIAWSPADGIAAGLDGSTGRLRWRRQMPRFSSGNTPPGLSADAGMALLSGTFGGVIEAASGDVQWGFSTRDLSPVHVELEEPMALLSTSGAHQQQPSLIASVDPIAGDAAAVNNNLWLLQPGRQPSSCATPFLTTLEQGAIPVIAAGRLWSGALSLPVDLPIAAHTSMSGQIVGSVGGAVIMAQAYGIFRIDAITGQSVKLGRADIMSARAIAFDGATMWIGDDQGLTLVDVSTTKIIASQAWPAEVTLPKREPGLPHIGWAGREGVILHLSPTQIMCLGPPAPPGPPSGPPP